MKLTKNFWLSEFDCKDGTKVPEIYLPNVILLAEQLEVIRDVLREPIYINSAYRHYDYNKAIGGSSRSQHLTASATDIRVKNTNASEVYRLLNQLMIDGTIHNGGLGKYNSFTHLDIRKNPARWDNSK